MTQFPMTQLATARKRRRSTDMTVVPTTPHPLPILTIFLQHYYQACQSHYCPATQILRTLVFHNSRYIQQCSHKLGLMGQFRLWTARRGSQDGSTLSQTPGMVKLTV